MKMNTCPFLEAKWQPHIRDIKYALGVFLHFGPFYNEKIGARSAPDMSAPIKTSQQGSLISGLTFYTLRIS